MVYYPGSLSPGVEWVRLGRGRAQSGSIVSSWAGIRGDAPWFGLEAAILRRSRGCVVSSGPDGEGNVSGLWWRRGWRIVEFSLDLWSTVVGRRPQITARERPSAHQFLSNI